MSMWWKCFENLVLWIKNFMSVKMKDDVDVKLFIEIWRDMGFFYFLVIDGKMYI